MRSALLRVKLPNVDSSKIKRLSVIVSKLVLVSCKVDTLDGLRWGIYPSFKRLSDP